LGQVLADHIDLLDLTVWELDLAHRIVACNQKAREVFGAQIEGQHCHLTCARTEAVCPDCPVSAAYADRRGARAEQQGYDRHGNRIHLDHIATPILDAQGELTGALVLLLDISPRKAFEDDLLQEQTRLREQMHRSQRLKSIGRLAGGIAHDLNNLLSPILGYGDILLEDYARDELLCNQLEEIVSAGKRARDLVAQLLAFSRQQTLRFKPVWLNLLLKRFEKLLRQTIRENIEIVMQLDPELPCIMGDGGQLEQVIMNLAINAQDAMPQGGRLILETCQVAADHNVDHLTGSEPEPRHVMLAVSDNGCGMAPEVKDHIFDPFFTTKEKYKGTGLGLATVCGIIKQHEGHIWAYSEPKVGTCIKVYLPIPDAIEEESPKMNGSPPKAVNGDETILLAEDNDGVRRLTRLVLERYGYTVLSAANAAEAIALAECHPAAVDLLLTDVSLPEMNGMELLDCLTETHPRMRALCMSGYPEKEVSHYGILDKGIDYIQKPFTNQDLAEKIRQILDRPRPSPEDAWEADGGK
jgi:signal transduction histidine kinase/CheY-like chemotaxis protein